MDILSEPPFTTEHLPKYDLPPYDKVTTGGKLNFVQIGKFLERCMMEVFAIAGAKDFFILHTITSLHALRYVFKYLKNEKNEYEALRYWWRAVVAAYVCQNRVHIQDHSEAIKTFRLEMAEEKIQSWKELIERAIASNDVHIIKLCLAAKFEEKEYDHDLLFRHILMTTMNKVHNESDWHF